jgi:NADH-quinone oxidoreductase subunit L
MAIVAFMKGISMLCHYIEIYVVEGVARLVTGVVKGVSSAGSKGQNGQVQMAGAVAFIGMTILLVAMIVKGGYFG